MSFIFNHCRTANELDNSFSRVRTYARDLFLAGKLTEDLRLKYERDEMFTLSLIVSNL